VRFAELANKRVAVWGAGREGRAAFEALRRRVPGLRVSVICREAERAEVLDWSSDPAFTPIRDILTTETDAELLQQFDLIIKSPGISPYQPCVTQAQSAGVQFISGTALWFAEHPEARVIAVTGTKGKSTTTALIAHLLRAAGKRVALAGNIGVPLLELLDPPQLPDWWVVELSSFQTRDMDALPEIAVVLNVYEEHLDWHGDAARYHADKLALLGKRGRRPRVSVIGARRALPAGYEPESGVVRFGAAPGYDVADGAIRRGTQSILALSELPLPGLHNALNLCAALAAVEAAGEDAVALVPTVRAFRPLPHRLQLLGERDGLAWVNDSIATTPMASIAALAHFHDREVAVIVGGYDRGVDWAPFRDAVRDAPPRAIVLCGANAARVAAVLQGLPAGAPRIERADGLAQAIGIARALLPPGGVVLLSPGAPSFDAFRDYADRGRRFAAMAGFDPGSISSIEGLGL
jgi:UDP-N-acetylmuramoylalanine--D-glutamate ligase